MLFEIAEIFQAHLTGGVLADAFEDVLHGDFTAVIGPRQDGPAVEEDAGDVQPQHGHQFLAGFFFRRHGRRAGGHGTGPH